MLVFLFLSLAVSCTFGDPWMPREVGRFRLGHAGFVEIFDTEDGEKELYITTFNAALPFFHDSVYFLKNPGNLLDYVSSWPNALKTLGGEATAYWPNYPVHMPSSVLGYEGVAQTSGFLVPGKNAGKIELYDSSNGERGTRKAVNIAAGQDHDWSYHWVVWKDVDNDGLIDAMTARFRVPLFGGDPISEFLWFKNPGTAPPGDGQDWAWQHYVLLTGGPDVYFEEEKFTICNPADQSDCTRYSVMVTGELWTERIMLYYVPDRPGAWANPANIKSVVVDDAPGQPFEAHFADLNNDGMLEILASCYDTRKGNETGNLWVYEDTGSGDRPWKRSALASGFVANPYLFGNSMTPGKTRLFWPSQEYKETPTEFGDMPKPWIALSGDDDGVHYVMFPKSEEPSNMEYDMKVMIDTEATTAGTMAVTDLDGDGFTEIVSAGYTAGEVYVYTFAP